MKWQNWSGRHQAKPDALAFVRSDADAAALVHQVVARGGSLRVAGAGHSHQPLVINDDTIVDVSGLSGVSAIDKESAQAWVRAGSSIYALGAALHAEGLALKNQGDIDRQLLSGAIATGTHGTGELLQNLSAGVIGLKIVTAEAGPLECSADKNADLFEAARVSLGAVGLITEIQMQLRQSCVLKESGFTASYAELAPRIEELTKENERFEFFWFPQEDTARVKLINETTEPPVYPLAEEGARQAYSHEVLPSHRPQLHTEMEYSLPREQGPECFAELRQLLQTQFTDLAWPVEYRTVAADDLWLSMATGRATVTLSVHQDIRQDETDYYQACEAVFRRYQGRPHWGKVNYLTADDLAGLYPRWQDWWRTRNAHDPKGVFLNDYMRSIAPAP
ncbi:MAG: D-arabinono-1,4-lactone oxidase [Pseudomonadales bacterium]